MLTKRIMCRKENTLSYITSTNSTTANITISSSAAIGDIAVLLDTGWNAGSVTSVVPSGWTTISNITASYVMTGRSILSYKVLTSGNPGSSITGMTATYNLGKEMLIFRPTSPISSVTVADLGEEGVGSGTPADQTVGINPLSYIVIGGGGSYSDTIVWDSTWYTSSITIATQRLAYKIFNSSPASTSIGTTTSATAIILQSCALVIT